MLRILSFTKTGTELNEKLCKKLNNDSCAGYAPKRILDRKEELTYLPENIPEWIQEYWGVDDFLFIGAAGIAVRMIAPVSYTHLELIGHPGFVSGDTDIEFIDRLSEEES